MASYPGSKVHRPGFAAKGKPLPAKTSGFTCTAAISSTFVIRLTFSVPVIISCLPKLLVNGGFHAVNFTQINPTQVNITISGAAAGLDWTLAPNDPCVKNYQGGGNSYSQGSL